MSRPFRMPPHTATEIDFEREFLDAVWVLHGPMVVVVVVYAAIFVKACLVGPTHTVHEHVTWHQRQIERFGSLNKGTNHESTNNGERAGEGAERVFT